METNKNSNNSKIQNQIPDPQQDWGKYEEEEENKFEKAAKILEESKKEKTRRVERVYLNRDLILSLDKEFLENCRRKFMIYSYLLNLSGLGFYYYTKSLEIKRWKRFSVLVPTLLFGHMYLLAFWMYIFPLRQYERGLVRRESREIIE